MQLDFNFKYCTYCKTERFINEFYKQSRNKDELANYCIECKKKLYRLNYNKFCDEANRRGREYFKNNKERVANRRKQYRQTPNYKISRSLRLQFKRLLCKNNSIIHPIFKTSGQVLRHSLEQQFKDGMNWNNKDQWNIVFKRSLRYFNLNDSDEVRQAFSPENISPVWKSEWKYNTNPP